MSDLVRLVNDEAAAQEEIAKDRQASPEPSLSFSKPVRDPRCNGLCSGTERHTLDSPAAFGKEKGTGRKLVYCTCCRRELVPVESLRPEHTQVISNIRPAKLNASLTADQRTVVCVICAYDVVVLRDIRVL
jgi:hypothetical protein